MAPVWKLRIVKDPEWFVDGILTERPGEYWARTGFGDALGEGGSMEQDGFFYSQWVEPFKTYEAALGWALAVIAAWNGTGPDPAGMDQIRDEIEYAKSLFEVDTEV